MKSLILADIHANLAALEAVLEAESTADEVLFLGDAVVGGPQPDEVLSLLRTLEGVFIIGNHDADVLEADPGVETDNPDVQWVQWTRRNISAANLEFLRSLPRTTVIERCGLSLRLCHGVVPDELGRRIWPDSPAEVFEWLAAQSGERYMLFGHSHVQFMKETADVTFVNPGSVGQPRLSQPLACYAVLEDGKFDLRAVPYDTERTCRAMDEMPLERGFVEDWKRSFNNGTVPARYGIRGFEPLRQMGYR